MTKKGTFLLGLAILPFLTIAQQWGYATLIAKQNNNSVQLLDTNNVVVKQWSNLSGNTGYSCYLTEGGTLWRTVTTSNSTFGGGGICGRVQKIAWDGTLLFDYTVSDGTQISHHDICPMPNGNVILIVYERKTATEVQAAGATVNAVRWSEKLVELKPTGTNTAEIVWEWHLWDHLVQNLYPNKANYQTSIVQHPELLNINYNNSGNMPDWVHMNGIDYHPELNQIVVSSHFLNEMWVIDHSTTTAQAASHIGGIYGKGGDFLYRWGNPAAYGASGTTIFNVMHDAHWIPEGSPNAGWLVGFNNKGVSNNQTAIDMFQTAWNGSSYPITLGQAYQPSTYNVRHQADGYSSNMGSSQQLPNGNMLVCLATAGKVYEIDPAGTKIWEYTTNGSIPQSKRYSRCFIENPIITAVTANPSVCSGGTVMLNITPASTNNNSYAYEWGPSTGLSSTIVQDPTVSGITSSTTYTVTVTTAGGCSATVSIPVIVKPAPNANAGNDVTILPGQTTTLEASGGQSYLWSNGAITTSIDVSPTSTMSYTVTVTGANGCTASDEVTVTVNQSVLASASASNGAVCPGGSTELLAAGSGGSGNYSYEWSSDPVGFSSTSNQPIVTPTATTIYTVTIADGTTSATASVTVTVHPAPYADAGDDVTIIAGQMATLTATGGVTYLWGDGAASSSISVSPISTTEYMVTATDGNGCTASDQLTVNVTPTVSVLVDASTSSFCLGSNTQLLASANHGTGSYNYSWTSDPPGFSSNLSNPTVSPTVSTIYTVVVDDGFTVATASINITVLDPPFADAGDNASVIIGGAVSLTATGGSTYLWSNGSDGQSINVAPTNTTTYSVTVTDDNGCTATDHVTVTVTGTVLSVMPTASNSVVCEGTNIALSANASGGTGNYSYAWTENGNAFSDEAEPIVSLNTTTTFSVVISDGNTSASGEVTVFTIPLPIANAGSDTSILIGTSTLLTVSGGDAYQWSNGATTESFTVAPIVTTSYTVTVTNIAGCSATDEVTVTVTGTLMTTSVSASENLVCLGKAVQVTASALGGSGNYSYQWSENSNVFSTEAQVTVLPLATTTYSYTVTDGISTQNGDITITILPLPAADAGQDVVITFGDQTTLTVSGGAQYIWSTGETAETITVNPITTTTYSVTVTSDQGCTATDEVTVTVESLPALAASISATDSILCLGDVIQLFVVASGGSSNYTYSWSSEPAGFTSGLPDPFVNPDQATVYMVVVNDGFTAVTLSLEIIVNPLPAQPTITTDGPTLISSSAINNQWFYYGTPVNGADGQEFTPSLPGAYQVQVVDENGCYSPLSEPYEYNFVSANEVLSDAAWKVFPNPASHWLLVEGSFDTTTFSLELRTSTGSLVLRQQNQKMLDVSALPNGMYLLQLKTRNCVNVRNLVISR